LPRPAFPAKINPFAPPPNQQYNLRVPACQEGRIAIVTDVGSECGGRGSDRCAGRIAGRALARERSAARQTNDAEAYGKTVWSWRPWLASSRRRRSSLDRVRDAVNSPMTEARGIRLRGERGISRKTIAQGMPECSDCTCMLVCASTTISCTRDRGCSKHPAVPAPSCLGETIGKARAKRAAGISTAVVARLDRAIRYSRDASDRAVRPRRTGYPACAGYDGWVG
jgi:hypothetical protein